MVWLILLRFFRDTLGKLCYHKSVALFPRRRANSGAGVVGKACFPTIMNIGPRHSLSSVGYTPALRQEGVKRTVLLYNSFTANGIPSKNQERKEITYRGGRL